MTDSTIFTIHAIEEIDLSGEDTTLIYKVVLKKIFNKYFLTVYRKHDDGWGLYVNKVDVLETFSREDAEHEFKRRCAIYRGEA